MRNLLVFIVFALFLSACTEKSVEIVEQSPEQNVEIRITGVKPTMVDPFNVSINVKGYGSDETVTTEIHSSELDSENVKFEWVSENECFFTFIQQDNTIRRMHLLIGERQLQLKEAGSNSADHLSM
ncbi:hypothetical protein RCC89_10395 [Cytophagaceae bacterium ABcell3]|nr:hypothetical protein RCC89_10395 [Cytophagaceae bacterium ABcell3]